MKRGTALAAAAACAAPLAFLPAARAGFLAWDDQSNLVFNAAYRGFAARTFGVDVDHALSRTVAAAELAVVRRSTGRFGASTLPRSGARTCSSTRSPRRCASRRPSPARRRAGGARSGARARPRRLGGGPLFDCIRCASSRSSGSPSAATFCAARLPAAWLAHLEEAFLRAVPVRRGPAVERNRGGLPFFLPSEKFIARRLSPIRARPLAASRLTSARLRRGPRQSRRLRAATRPSRRSGSDCVSRSRRTRRGSTWQDVPSVFPLPLIIRSSLPWRVYTRASPSTRPSASP